MAATDAKPFPIRNTAYRVTFPLLDADGDLVSAAGSLDSEVSKDGAAFADCTNEATEIGTTGMYYLDLTSTEMDADTVAIIIKSAGAKTTPIVLYPVEGGDIDVDVTHIAGSAVSTSTAQLGVNVVNAAGTAWASGAITAAVIATGAIDADAIADNAIDAGAIAADAITAAKIADGAIDAATFAAGAITAAVIATGAIDADALAADAGTEIAAAVWGADATTYQAQGTFGQAIGDPAADANTIYGAVVTGAAGATIAADIVTIDGIVDSILVDTGTTLQGELDGIQADTEDIQAKIGTPSDLGSGATVAANLADIDVSGGGGLDAAGVRAAIGLASANLDTQLAAIDDAIDTEVAAIKAKTDNLPADPADASDIAAAFATVNSALTTIDDFLDTEIAAIKAKTDNLPADPADASDIAASFVTVNAAIADLPTNAELATALADLPTNAELSTALGTADDAVLAAIAGLNDISPAEVGTEVDTALNATIADSVPADGTRPSVRQALYMIAQFLMDKEVAGTTVTVNKPDGTTALMTFTLDDAANPTTITRTT